jgi:hypothetical protein
VPAKDYDANGVTPSVAESGSDPTGGRRQREHKMDTGPGRSLSTTNFFAGGV